MPILRKFPLALGLVVIVGACAREPEPETIRIAPTIDKLGNATCPAGTTLAVEGGSGVQVCVDPATT